MGEGMGREGGRDGEMGREDGGGANKNQKGAIERKNISHSFSPIFFKLFPYCIAIAVRAGFDSNKNVSVSCKLIKKITVIAN